MYQCKYRISDAHTHTQANLFKHYNHHLNKTIDQVSKQKQAGNKRHVSSWSDKRLSCCLLQHQYISSGLSRSLYWCILLPLLPLLVKREEIICKYMKSMDKQGLTWNSPAVCVLSSLSSFHNPFLPYQESLHHSQTRQSFSKELLATSTYMQGCSPPIIIGLWPHPLPASSLCCLDGGFEAEPPIPIVDETMVLLSRGTGRLGSFR